MYDDEQLADMRFHFSRAIEAIRRQIEAARDDKDQLQDAYTALSQERSSLGTVVWEIPSHSLYNAMYTTAYNDLDSSAEYLSYALGDGEDDRERHLVTCEQFLTEAATALTS